MILAILILASNLAHGALTVRVGVHESKPLSFSTKDGIITGIYPEVIQEVARLAGWEIEWVKVSWVEGLQMVQDGRVDLLGPIGFTQERQKRFHFNNEAVFVDWGQIYLSKNYRIHTILDLAGKKVVFQEGHIMGKKLIDLLERFDIDCELESVKDQKKVFEMVSSGNADAGAVNRLFGLINEKSYDIQRSPIIYAPLELRFAAPINGDTKIIDQLDSLLKILKDDKESNYHHILDKWLFGTLEPGRHATMKQVLAIVGIGLAIVLVMFIWMMLLKIQVKTRTKELANSTKRLKKANLLLNAVMENTTDAVFIKNLAGEYLLANTSACKAMGKSLDQVIGKTDGQLFPAESADIINKIDALVLKTTKPQLVEEKLQTVYGETYWLANKSPYLDENKKVRGLIGISRDITELKTVQLEKDKLQDQLRQAHKMEAIGTLAGGIAHDFNNILGIIIGNIELAYDDIPSWNPARKNMDEVKIACFRARDVVRQLLSFSRKTKQSQKPVVINDIVTESTKLLRASIPTTIDINVHLLKENPRILADATQIHQVIINLCTNAAHAMEEEGGILGVEVVKVHIGDEDLLDFGEIETGDYIQIIVTDTGQGIDPEIQKKMFDPYYTSKETGKGTGLGLAVVHGIVKNHNGAISVHSELKKGSTIRVFFPESKLETAKKQISSEALPTGSERILFVDDEISLVEIGRLMMEKLGYGVEIETDSKEALNLFRSNPSRFDLVITDMTMPRLTGEEMAREMLGIRPDIPIILCTGFSDKVNSESVLEVGIRKYIEKPLNQKVFARIIREVLDEPGKKNTRDYF